MTNLGILSTEFLSWSDFTPHWWCSDLCYCPWQARFAGAQPRPLCKTVLCHLFGLCVRKRLLSAADPYSTWLLNNRFFKFFFPSELCTVTHSFITRALWWAQPSPGCQGEPKPHRVPSPWGGSLGYFLLPRSECVAPFSSACLSVQKPPGKP